MGRCCATGCCSTRPPRSAGGRCPIRFLCKRIRGRRSSHSLHSFRPCPLPRRPR
jgi:hypothetical protein